LVCLGPAQAWAEQGRAESAAESAIRNALAKWTTDFNARRAEAACSLFAPDLRYDVQGLGERGYDVICRRLHASLADTTKRYRYELRVKEVLVAGNLAVVRLVWQLGIPLPVAGRCQPMTRLAWMYSGTSRTGLADHSLPRV
jgi:ketosteroid isomerase-like protein